MMNLDDNNLILIFNILLYTITLIVYYIRKKYFSIGAIILLIYSIIATISLSLFNDSESYYYWKEVTLFPFLYLYILILIASYPLLKLDERKIQKIYIPEKKILIAFSILIILVNLVSIVDVVASFDKILINMIADTSNASELYNDARDSDSSSTGINYIAVLMSAFRDFPQFLLLYFLTLKNNSKWLIAGLSVAVIISLLSGLVNGLRGNVIFVLQSTIFLYIFFSKYYSAKIKKAIRVGFLIIFVSISIPFIAISVGRFDTSYSSISPGYALKSYTSQSFLNFNLYGLDNNGIRYGDRTINLFKKTIYDDVSKDFEERRIKFRYLKINDEVFSTFVGEFTLDFGPIATFIIFTIISVFLTIRTRVVKGIFLHQILLLYFLWNTIIYGIFLFPYSDTSGNIRIVFCIILVIILKITTSSKNFVVRNNINSI